jgi:DNA-binding transcriptional MocR family regulator
MNNDPQSISTPAGEIKEKPSAAAAYINPYRLFCGSPIPEWLEPLSTISAGAKLCYARLCRFAGKNGVAWPHQKTLAAKLGVSDRTIRAYLRELKDAGLIETRPRRIKGLLTHQHEYLFPYHPAMGLFCEDPLLSNRQESSASKWNNPSAQKRKRSSASSYEDNQNLRKSSEGKVLPLFANQKFSRRVNEKRRSEPAGYSAIREFLGNDSEGHEDDDDG